MPLQPKTTNKEAKHSCLHGLKKKEESDEEVVYEALVATTHPDRTGDILSEKVIDQIVTAINDDSNVGSKDYNSNVRGLSLFHDWIHEENPELDEAGFMSNARKVSLDNGHTGVEVDVTVNKYYDGDFEGKHYDPNRIHYEIEHGKIGGLSIEYTTEPENVKDIEMGDENFNFIEELSDFTGAGFARSRMIANPSAVIYKEIIDRVEGKNLEDKKMSEKEKKVKEEVEEKSEEVEEEQSEEESQEEDSSEESSESEEESEESEAEPEAKEVKKTLSAKEIVESKEFKKALDEVKVDNKVLKDKEEKMDNKTISVKELNEHIVGKEMNIVSFKEAAKKFLSENKEINTQLQEHGIPLKEPTIQVKCSGNKLVIASGMQTKDILDTSSNTTTYTQSAVEFSDIFVPGLIDTFNNRTDLFDALPKVDHVMGTPNFAWRVSASQKSSLSVDVDDPTIVKSFMDKVKLQTPIKEYRNGISVTDFMLIHSRASIGDLFMIEAEKAMIDLRKDINKDLYNENADGDSTDVLGLEAVADSAGNTTLYGLTRSTSNRLAPAAAGDTYEDVSGSLTLAYARGAIRKVELDGASRGSLRMIVSPLVRDALFALQDDKQQYLSTDPRFGFAGAIGFDGVPLLVDPDCPATASEAQLYVVDFDSYKVVISRAPQLVGLAKVSAAQEAYVVIDLAVVYERPRRIHMLDNLTP